jgi:hypothetical protein
MPPWASGILAFTDQPGATSSGGASAERIPEARRASVHVRGGYQMCTGGPLICSGPSAQPQHRVTITSAIACPSRVSAAGAASSPSSRTPALASRRAQIATFLTDANASSFPNSSSVPQAATISGPPVAKSLSCRCQPAGRSPAWSAIDATGALERLSLWSVDGAGHGSRHGKRAQRVGPIGQVEPSVGNDRCSQPGSGADAGR